MGACAAVLLPGFLLCASPSLALAEPGSEPRPLTFPFDFTAGRSFGGASFTVTSELGVLTGVYAMPTQGGFEVDLSQTIDDVRLGVLSWTAPMFSDPTSRGDVQLFAYL